MEESKHTTKSEKWWEAKRAKVTFNIIGMFFLAVFVLWLFLFMPYVSTDDARVDADIIKIGNLGATGQVEKVYIKNGEKVSAGTLLAELDHSSAQANFDRAKAAADFAQAELKRASKAVTYQGISTTELNRIQQRAAISEADLKLAKIALDRTYLKSTINGTVLQVNVQEGNILETNQVAFMIADISKAWISAYIQEKSVGKVEPGQKVYINVDEGGKLTGTVEEVRKAAASVFSLIPVDNTSGNFTKVEQRIHVTIALDPHEDKELRVGQSVEIKIKVR